MKLKLAPRNPDPAFVPKFQIRDEAGKLLADSVSPELAAWIAEMAAIQSCRRPHAQL